MVRLGVVGGHDRACHGSHEHAPKAWKTLRRLWTKEGSESKRRRAAVVINGYKVDGIRRGETRSAVARYPVRGTVLNEPAALERVLQIKRIGHSDLLPVDRLTPRFPPARGREVQYILQNRARRRRAVIAHLHEHSHGQITLERDHPRVGLRRVGRAELCRS